MIESIATIVCLAFFLAAVLTIRYAINSIVEVDPDLELTDTDMEQLLPAEFVPPILVIRKTSAN